MQIKAFVVSGVLGAALLTFSGCATGGVQYRDASEVRTLNTNFNFADVNQNVMAMVDSMLSSPVLANKLGKQFPDKTPTISITEIRNQTNQFIKLSALSNSIRTKLINSGKFEFIDTTTDKEVTAELMRAADGVLVDASKAVPFGTQEDADYILYGTLYEMREEGGNVKSVYYRLNMNLLNKRTGKIDWTDEKDINKEVRRGAVGW